MAKHVYVDPSKFRAPLNYPNLTLTGLGEALRQKWPPGRSYVDTSRFWAPYLSYEFQDNTLFGLGDAMPTEPLPPKLQAYLQTGMPMNSLSRDVGSAMAQVPRVLWGVMALSASYMTYKAWKRFNQDKKDWDKTHPEPKNP